MITIQQQPQLFTTLNSALFKIVSDRPTILQFLVTIIDAESNNIMTTQKYATFPTVPRGTFFDLAPLLSAFVQPQILNTGVSLEAVQKIYKKYYLNITEIYLDENNMQVTGETIGSGVFNILNATLSRTSFKNFFYSSFVMGNGSVSTFLSKRPLFSRISYNEKEFIYLATTTETIVRVIYFKRDGSIVTTRETAVTGSEVAYRVDISPLFLVQPFQSPFNDVFTPPFNGFDGSNLTTHFTVQAFTPGGDPLSEVKTYVLHERKCNERLVQLFFVNNLGGLDSFPFIAPTQSVSKTKTTIRANEYQFDNQGNYKDNYNGVFNPEVVTIGSETTNSFSLTSDPLTDEMSEYAKSLIESENVFLKLPDGSFLPIEIDQQEYLIERNIYSTANKRLKVTFKLNDVDFDLSKNINPLPIIIV